MFSNTSEKKTDLVTSAVTLPSCGEVPAASKLFPWQEPAFKNTRLCKYYCSEDGGKQNKTKKQ